MVNGLLMFATVALGFGGSPWIGFVIGASLIVVFSIPQQRGILNRYRGHPKTDIVFAMLLDLGVIIAGAFASAWFGYYLALLFKR
jgi:hypothetical protein